MKNLKNISVLLMVFFACVSCKEYLDVKPKGEVIPKTAEEFGALLNSHLSEIDDGYDEAILGNAMEKLELECFSDNVENSLTKNVTGMGAIPKYVGDRLNSFKSEYEKLYALIKNCNLVIHEMEETDTEMAKACYATAYTLRGVAYYNLMRLFCEPYNKQKAGEQLGLSIVTRFDMEARPKRSSLLEIVSLIEEDLKKGISYNSKSEIFRYTVDVAKAYLARLYFWSQNWEQAIPVAKEILEAYPLVEGTEYVDMLSAQHAQKGNILLRSYVLSHTSGDQNYNGAKGYLVVKPVSKSFIDLFVEKERDVRYSFLFNNKREAKKVPLACVRSAEMCLIVAESYAYLNQTKEALEYLNLLRSKRISDYTPYVMGNLPAVDELALVRVNAEGGAFTPLLWAIHCERRKELFMEGDRWFDLKRNGCPEFWIAKDGLKYETKQFMYTAPIPSRDIDLIPGMIQNEGYVK